MINLILNNYKDEKLTGQKKWYQDYMNKNIKTSQGYIGLPKEVYTLKPAKMSDFEYSYKIEEFKDPKNFIEDIRQLFKNVFTNLNSMRNKGALTENESN